MIIVKPKQTFTEEDLLLYIYNELDLSAENLVREELKCNSKLHETYFELNDIEQDFLPRFKEYYNSEEMRTCKSCGHVMETDARFSS